jgi:hypothetical protein
MICVKAPFATDSTARFLSCELEDARASLNASYALWGTYVDNTPVGAIQQELNSLDLAFG